MSDNSNSASGGTGCLTVVFGFIVSFALNHSFWWGIFHGLFWPFYFIYLVCTGQSAIAYHAVQKLFGA